MKRIALGIALIVVSLSAQPAPREIAPATSEKTEVFAIKSQVRISRIVIFAENGAAGVVVMRERQHLAANGRVLETERLPMVRRNLQTAAAETVTGPDGKTVTLDQVLGLLNQFSAKWTAEDEPKNQVEAPISQQSGN